MRIELEYIEYGKVETIEFEDMATALHKAHEFNQSTTVESYKLSIVLLEEAING